MERLSYKFSVLFVCFLAICGASEAQWTSLTGSVARFGAAHWTLFESNGTYIYSGSAGPTSFFFMNTTTPSSPNFQYIGDPAATETPSWSPVTPGAVSPGSAAHPGHRERPCFVQESFSSPGDTRLWLYGGVTRRSTDNSLIFANDLWYYSVAQKRWRFVAGTLTGTASSNAPLGTHICHLWVDQSTQRLLFFGGRNTVSGLVGASLNEMWSFDIAGISESSAITRNYVKLSGSLPSARYGGHHFSDGSKHYLFGGGNEVEAPKNDLWMFDATTNAWQQVQAHTGTVSGAVGSFSSTNRPEPAGQQARFPRHPSSRWQLHWGGGDGTKTPPFYSSLWALNLDTLQWYSVYNIGPYISQAAHAHIQGNILYVYGGFNGGAIAAVASFTLVCPTGFITDSSIPATCIGNCAGNAAVVSGACAACSPGSFTNPSKSACVPCVAGTYSDGSSCVSCAPGTTSSSGSTSCESCPNGKYSNSTTQYLCVDCPAGFTTTTGSTSSCSICRSGTYSNSATGFICINCPAGQVSTAGSPCTNCPAGTSSVSGSATCTNCLAGEYSNATSNFVCQKCPLGTTSSAGARTCTTCPINTYAATQGGFSVCLPCPAGSQNLENPAATSCTLCPSNFYSKTGGSCIACPGDSSSPEGSANCTQCLVGSHILGPNGVCTECPANTMPLKKACAPCPLGLVRPLGNPSCGPCPAGTYVVVEKPNTMCKACAAGTWSDAGSSSCNLRACSVGQTRDPVTKACQSCPAGTFPAVEDGVPTCINCTLGSTSSIGDSFCRKCSMNTFGILSMGRPICSMCPMGQYQPAEGSTSCLPCPSTGTIPQACNVPTCGAGFYRDSATRRCVALPAGVLASGPELAPIPAPLGMTTEAGKNTTIPCPINFYGVLRAIPGGLTAAICEPCPVGTTSGRGSTSCQQACSPGFYRQSPTQCAPCPAGWYQPSTTDLDLSACLACPTGMTTPSTGSSSRSQCSVACPPGTRSSAAPPNRCVSSLCTGKFCPNVCQPGLFLNATTKTCQRCPPGTFMPVYNSDYECRPCATSPPELDGARICAGCNAGTFFNGTGCTQCTNGFFSAAGAQSLSECNIPPCAAGKFRNMENELCEDCPVGTYTSTTNNLPACIACPRNQYQALTGRTSCDTCPTDLVPNEMRSSCVPCVGPAIGIFNSSCVRCPSGTEAVSSALAAGSSVCVACNSSSYSNLSTGSRCALCPRDSISSASRTDCVPCAAGLVPNSDQTGCIACQPGSRGGAFNGICLSICPNNTASTAVGVNRQCVPCSSGTCSDAGSPACGRCRAVSCPLFYSSVNGVCQYCPPNYHAVAPGQCVPCKQGWASRGGAHAAIFCASTDATCRANQCTFCEGRVSEDGYCVQCQSGEYWTGTKCELCPQNTFSRVSTWSDTPNACTPCPEGSFSGVGATDCLEGCDFNKTDCFAGFRAIPPCRTRPGLLLSRDPQSLAETCWTCRSGFVYDESTYLVEGAAPRGWGPCRRPFQRGKYSFGISLRNDNYIVRNGKISYCPPKTAPTPSKDSCLSCPIGMRLVNGACAFCPSGFYGTDIDRCDPILYSKFYSRGIGTQGLAKECPANWFASNDNTQCQRTSGLTRYCGYHVGNVFRSGNVLLGTCTLDRRGKRRSTEENEPETALVEDIEESPEEDAASAPPVAEIPIALDESVQPSSMAPCFEEDNLFSSELNLGCGFDQLSGDFGYCRSGRCTCPPGFRTAQSPIGAQCRGYLTSNKPAEEDFVSPDDFSLYGITTFIPDETEVPPVSTKRDVSATLACLGPAPVDPTGSTFSTSISSFQYDQGLIFIDILTPYEQPQDLTDPSIENYATVTSFEWVGASSIACDLPAGAGLFLPRGVSDTCQQTWSASAWSWTELVSTCGAFFRQQTANSVVFSAELKVARTYVVKNGRITDQRTAESRHLLSVVFPLVLDFDTTEPIVIFANNVNWNGNMILRSISFDRTSPEAWVAVFRGSSGYPYKLSAITPDALALYKMGSSDPVAFVTSLTDCLAASPGDECWQDLTVRFTSGCSALFFDATEYLYLGPSTLSFECRSAASSDCPFVGSRFLSTTQNAIQVSNLVTQSACAITSVNIEQPLAAVTSHDALFASSGPRTAFVDGDIVGLRLELTMPGTAGRTDTIQASRIIRVSFTDSGAAVLAPATGSYVPEAAVSSLLCQDSNGNDLSNVVCFTLDTGMSPFTAVPEGSSRTYRFTVRYEVTLQGSTVTRRFIQDVAVQKTYTNSTNTSLAVRSKASVPTNTGTVGGAEGTSTVVWILAGILAAVLIAVIGAVSFWRYRKYRKTQASKRMEKEDLKTDVKVQELQERA